MDEDIETGQQATPDEIKSDEDRKDEQQEDVDKAWKAAKSENLERDKKYYEIPEEFPFLMHASSIANIESILSNGLVPKSGQAREEYTFGYVDKAVVCAVAPKKLTMPWNGEEFTAFPSSAHRGLGHSVRVTFKMPAGEKIYMEDISGDHPRECRIDRRITSDQMNSIQDMGDNSRDFDGSLWGFFTQNAMTGFWPIRSDIYNHGKSLELSKQWPECFINGADLDELFGFLVQYGISDEEKTKLDHLNKEFLMVSREATEIWEKVYYSILGEVGAVEKLSRSVQSYETQKPELHQKVVDILSQIKEIFKKTTKDKINIDPSDEESFTRYLDYLRDKYQLSHEEYQVRDAYSRVFDSK